VGFSRKGRRVDAKGRSRAGPKFVRLFHYVMDSPAYTELSTTARAALIEICRLYNGINNGRLAVPVRSLAERLNVSRATAARALTELDDAGFVSIVRFGSFRRHDRVAAEYRLTFCRCDALNQRATNDFLHRRPPNPRSQK
jgi:DNA-binding transcriptional regulator YhcF (GntR family)